VTNTNAEVLSLRVQGGTVASSAFWWLPRAGVRKLATADGNTDGATGPCDRSRRFAFDSKIFVESVAV
jgi:hypothetical protein